MGFDRVKRGKRSTEGPGSKTVYRTTEECQYSDYANMNSSMENLSIWKESTDSSKSSAEYSKKWREKMKQEPEFLENERSRKKKERQNMTPEMKATVKEKARLRQQNYRQRKKCENSESKESADVKPDKNVPKKRRRNGEEDENGNPMKKSQKESSNFIRNAWHDIPYGCFSEEDMLHIQSIIQEDISHSSLEPLGNSTDNLESCPLTELNDGNVQKIVPGLYKGDILTQADEKTHFSHFRDIDEQNEFPAFEISNEETDLSFLDETSLDDIDTFSVESSSTNMNNIHYIINNHDANDPRVEEHGGDEKVQEWPTDVHVGNQRTSRNIYEECLEPDEMNTFGLRSSLLDLGIRQKFKICDVSARPTNSTTVASRQRTNNTQTASKRCKEHAERELEKIRNEVEHFRLRSAYLKQKIDKLSKRCGEIENENYTKIKKYKYYFHDLMVLNEHHNLNRNDNFVSNANAVVPGRKKLRYRTNDNVYKLKKNLNNRSCAIEVVPTESPSCCVFKNIFATSPCACG